MAHYAKLEAQYSEFTYEGLLKEFDILKGCLDDIIKLNAELPKEKKDVTQEIKLKMRIKTVNKFLKTYREANPEKKEISFLF